MSTITLKLTNYKLLENIEETLPDCRVLLVTGKNEIGKSSLIRALIENMTAKATTEEPVTKGQKSGEKTFTIPDKNGNPITIVHQFSEKNKKGSFYAVSATGEKIKEVKKIRELVGVFEEIPIDEFWSMQKTAEGRRKIIKTYFYPLLSEKERQRIEEIDKQTAKGGEVFDERTNVNSMLATLRSLLNENLPSEQDKLLSKEYDNVVENLQELQKKGQEAVITLNRSSDIKEKIETINQELEDLPNQISENKRSYKEKTEEIDEDIQELEEKIIKLKQKRLEEEQKYYINVKAIGEKETELLEKSEKLQATLDNMDPEAASKIHNKIKEAEEVKRQADEAKNKVKNYEQKYQSVLKHEQRLQDLEKDIRELREEKTSILEKSKLPQGLEIEGDTFTWNGFAFTDNQISKSSAMLVIAEILCNVTESKIVYIGERSLFDTERFKQLVQLAEKHGKIPVLEQVIDDQSEVKVITEIEG